MADVLAAVDASATKEAHRSDWTRFTIWTTERGVRPVARAAAGSRALRHGGGGGADIGGEEPADQNGRRALLYLATLSRRRVGAPGDPGRCPTWAGHA